MRLTWALSLMVLTAACGPKTYQATGRVEDVRADLGQLVIAHEDIEGLMPAMTMSFDVASPDLQDGVVVGDRVRFELTGADDGFRILAIERVERAPAGAKKGGRLADLVTAEDAAPDFTLVDQDGNERSLASLAGRLVLLDFVYTTCPGPCPILTALHAQVQQRLPEAVRDRVWFASISLDPAHDTPERMREYALARGADLETWSFLTGAPASIDSVLASYGVGSVPTPEGTIEHVVVTFLIDGQGRVLKRYFGLNHDVEEYLRDLERES